MTKIFKRNLLFETKIHKDNEKKQKVKAKNFKESNPGTGVLFTKQFLKFFSFKSHLNA